MSEYQASIEAKAVVDAILTDLADRGGLRQAWDGIDEDVQEEIRKTWEGVL